MTTAISRTPAPSGGASGPGSAARPGRTRGATRRGRLVRAVTVVAVVAAAAGGVSAVAAPPAVAATTWSGSFDEHAHHVSVTQVSRTLSRSATRVRQCGGQDPCTPADPTGQVVGVRGANVTTFTYTRGRATSTISVNRDQRDLPVAYAFPAINGTSERQVRTLNGDAYRRWVDGGGTHWIDVRYQETPGQWVWRRFSRERIDQVNDGSVFQYNQLVASINRVETLEAGIAGVSVLGAAGDLILAGSRRLDPVVAVFALCGITAGLCIAARQRYTSSDASADATRWLYARGYGSTPTSGT